MGKTPTKHMPSRGETQDRTSKKELSELKSENHRLRRKLSRLEAFISKHAEYSDEVVEKAMEEEFELAPEVEKALKTDVCPMCKSTEVRILDLGIKMFMICGSCQYRKPLS